MKFIGFVRVIGFDHQIRCITDAPKNDHGQRHVVYADGNTVFDGYMYTGDEILPESELSGVPGGSMDRSERTEWRMCSDWLRFHDRPTSTESHIIDA